MSNLLNAEFYKLRKSRGIYIGVLASAALVLMIYGSLVMVDKINQGVLENGTGGIVVSPVASSAEDGSAPESMLKQVGVIGVLQQMFGGHFVGIIAAILVSIFVIREFSSGMIKNLVGKGYPRPAIFLAKMISAIVLVLVFEVAVAAVSILLGIPFLRWEEFSATPWEDVAVYVGLQLLFGAVIAAIFVLAGELTRNLAAGISVSIGVLLFSTTLTAGLDLIFHGIARKPSEYWVLDLVSVCPLTDVPSEFIRRSVLVSAAWFVITLALGILHFRKADVK
ncbi:MAG: ABC transporter permease subunit [Lachnospiraceae bacterium]|nr:ABC transporter permease subunit [Lachnospiraceae bacterium]